MERCLHSRAVGENKTPDALLYFLRVRSVIWRYGSPSRTKSQGQIFWLCRNNSWVEQTRKSLHFIKDPAGEQQSFSSSPPTLSLSLHINTRLPSAAIKRPLPVPLEHWSYIAVCKMCKSLLLSIMDLSWILVFKVSWPKYWDITVNTLFRIDRFQ